MSGWLIVVLVATVVIGVVLAVLANWLAPPAWMTKKHIALTLAGLTVVAVALAIVGQQLGIGREAEGTAAAAGTTTAAASAIAASTTTTAPTTTTAKSTRTTSTTSTDSASSASVTPAQPSRQFVADLKASKSSPSTGAVEMNGQSYPHALYGRFGGCQTDIAYTYSLGRKWSQFTATVGIRDGGDTDSVLQFEVYADDALIYSSGNVGVGESPNVAVSVAGALNLKLRYLFIQGNKGLCSNPGYAVWGDATVIK